MLDRFLLHTASSADYQEVSSGQDGIKAFLSVNWKEVSRSCNHRAASRLWKKGDIENGEEEGRDELVHLQQGKGST